MEPAGAPLSSLRRRVFGRFWRCAKKNNSRPENFPEFLRPGFTEDVRIPKAQGEHGGSKTGFALAHCEDNLKQVQSEMTPAQILHAQHMVEEWKKQHPTP